MSGAAPSPPAAGPPRPGRLLAGAAPAPPAEEK